MHITDIKITNFRGIKKLCLDDLPAVLLLIGRNGTGKTTVLDAIRFALTGVVRDANGNALKLERLVGPHGSKGEIIIGLSDGKNELAVSVDFTASRSVFSTEPPLPGKAAEQRLAVWKHFGLNPDHERLALDPLALLLGNDILDGLAGNETISEEKLRFVFGDRYEQAVQLLSGYQLSLETTSDVDRIYNTCYDLRTKVNRAVKSLQDDVDRNGATHPLTAQGKKITKDDIPKIHERIRVLMQKRNELDGQIINAESGRTVDQISSELQASMTELSGLKQKPIKPFKKPEKPAVTVTEDELKRLQTAWHEVQKQHDKALDKVTTLAEQAGYADKGVCPTCGQEIPPEVLAKLEQEIEKADAVYADAETALAVARKAYDKVTVTAQQEKSAICKWEQECAMLDRDHEHAVQDAEHGYKHEKQRLEFRIKELENEKPAGDAKALQAEREKTQRTLENEQTILDGWRDWSRKQADVQELAKQSQTAELLSWMLGILKEPATMKALGGDQSTAFEIQMNDVLSIFGYRIRVNWDSSCIEITEDAVEHWRPMSEASAGELTIAQIAIADVYGSTGLSLIDRFEGVDSDHASNVWNLLRAPVGGRVIAQTGETVVSGITSVNMEETEAA